MNIEHELKFVNDHAEQIIQQLRHCGGKQFKARHLLRRCTFDPPNSPRGTFVRVRDEGDHITLAYKQRGDQEISELEERVESFEKTIELLTRIGLSYASYEENYRESYILGETFITFDTWPGLSTFMEIEAPDEQQLMSTVFLLGLDATQGITGTVDEIYKLANIDISALREITFQTIPSKV